MWLERISDRERPYCGSRLPAITRPARLPSTPPTPIVDARPCLAPGFGPCVNAHVSVARLFWAGSEAVGVGKGGTLAQRSHH